MKNFNFWTLLISGMFVFASCDNDDNPNGNGNVPQAVLDAFESQYGDTRANWSVKDGYAIAQFSENNGDATAWYALDKGSDAWSMTKTEEPISSLPEAITTAIESSAYATWDRDQTVDVLERNNAEKLYVIEVKNGGVEVDLYYTEAGVMISETVDSDGKENDYTGYLPQTPAAGIDSWIESNFPGAKIVDIDVESNGTEVEIIHDNMKHEILFDKQENWMQTKTEYGSRNVPEVVRTFINNSADYRNYEIDDVDKYTTPDNVYYSVELEGSNHHKENIYLNEQGEQISRPIGDINTGGGSEGTISGIDNVLETKYPGYRITDREHDDGVIEIEIRHDGRDKEVYFTRDEAWIYTNYDIRSSALPEAVKSTLNSEFGENSYWDEDSECYETPQGTFYEVEVYDEIDVLLNESGEILRIDD